MPADPQPGDVYRQEYYPPGEALDQARVLGIAGERHGARRHLREVRSPRSSGAP